MSACVCVHILLCNYLYDSDSDSAYLCLLLNCTVALLSCVTVIDLFAKNNEWVPNEGLCSLYISLNRARTCIVSILWLTGNTNRITWSHIITCFGGVPISCLRGQAAGNGELKCDDTTLWIFGQRLGISLAKLSSLCTTWSQSAPNAAACKFDVESMVINGDWWSLLGD